MNLSEFSQPNKALLIVSAVIFTGLFVAGLMRIIKLPANSKEINNQKIKNNSEE